MNPRNRDLDTLAHRIDRAARVVPEVLDHLNEQRALIPAISAHPTDTAGSSAGGHSDPTLRTMMELDVVNGRRAAILDGIATLNVCVNMLEDACRQALGYRTPDAQPAPRCIGDNTAQGAACWNVPCARRLPDGGEVDDGRCIECGPRHDRARRAASDARRMRRHMETLGEHDAAR